MDAKKILTASLVVLMAGCVSTPQKKELTDRIKCKIEIYCTATEGGIAKKSAKGAIKAFWGVDVPDICEKHYQAWGIDYRLPAVKRCGGE